MRAVCQRVRRASVSVDGTTIAAIERGWLVLLGVGPRDSVAEADYLVDRLAGLRAFEDDGGRMNLAARAAGAAFLIVSQFTLYADTRSGRRPGFTGAAPPDQARVLVEHFGDALIALGFRVERGRFGANMAVELVNDGPVTIVFTTDGWS
jgi:D-tyrosyl-tRNA(Tyr) deacylase